MKISLVCSTRNNLKYLKWSYDSVRKNQGQHEVWLCYGVDHCTDGTLEWLQELSKTDTKVKFIVNNTGHRLGHTVMYDKIVYELVETDLAMIWHSDMYLCEGALDAIESLIEPNTIVSLTRIEPPLHPSGPEKIVKDFGTEPENFNEHGLIEFVKNQPYKPPTDGVFAPWCFWVSEFKEMGGHDWLYKPQSKEDCVKYDTLVFTDINGYKSYLTLNELWERYSELVTVREDGNLVIDLNNAQISVLSPKSNGEFGFEKLRGMVRKIVDSNRMYDVRTNWGIVTVTDDHSLIDNDCNGITVNQINNNIKLWEPKKFTNGKMRRNLLKSIDINGFIINEIDEFGNPRRLLDICEFLGFFVAEGSVVNESNCISICQNNLQTLEYMKLLSNSLFGDNFWGKLIIDENKGENIKPVYIYRKTNSYWGSYLMNLIGKNSEHKKVPDFIYNLPKVYQEAFLYGYLVGDGYLGTSISKNGSMESFSVDKRMFYKKGVFTQFQWKSTSKSKILTAGVNLLLRRCFPETITTINFAKDKGSNGVYNISTLNTDYRNQIIQITPHQTESQTTVVFDLEVRNTHTFIGGIGLIGLHNSDIFNRYQLKHGKNCFKQTWQGFVYHLTCRGSRYNPTLTQVGQDSAEWSLQNNRSYRNFIRKWHSLVKHTDTLEPIVSPVYHTTFIIHNCSFIDKFEIWCHKLILPNCNKNYIEAYIKDEQPNTDFDLHSKIHNYKIDFDADTDIIVEFDMKRFDQHDFNNLVNLSDIIAQSGEVGEFELGNLKVKIHKMQELQNKLITVNNKNIDLD